MSRFRLVGVLLVLFAIMFVNTPASEQQKLRITKIENVTLAKLIIMQGEFSANITNIIKILTQ